MFRKKQFYFGIQYISEISLQFAHKIKFLLEKYFTFGEFDPYFKKNISTLELFSRFYKNSEKCQTPGVYKISCWNCDQIYVGQTGRVLSLRIKEQVLRQN